MIDESLFEISQGLQVARMNAVVCKIEALGAKNVLDLGCGDAELLARLAALDAVRHVRGIDRDPLVIAAARESLAACPRASEKVELEVGSLFDVREGAVEVDVVTAVEVIEHLDPRQLTAFERQLFERLSPATVIVTTPNRDYNPLLGLPAGRFRHPEHRFEWGRGRFIRWAERVARQWRYLWTIEGIGRCDPAYGEPTQMATFMRTT